ncbi:mechanosensitive ion channel [Planctomicrobium sp.]|jgi:small conductance mechanosensitive channel|nr:mechanosensitive ion channel domain-containing protein [Planctomicrobium sp.]MDA7503631.1 mechanosensitive ion channel [bacterium]MDB4731800.1 mechanosensitive ion channel [bacterium]MDB4743310.1 mechanosensitive ion channel [Planctomicrobium sp.]
MFQIIAQTDTTDGVTEIVKSVEETLPWLAPAKDYLAENAVALGLRVVAALAIFLIGRIVVSMMLGFVGRALKRSNTDAMLISFANNVLKAILLIVLAMASLQTLGVKLTSLTAILAAGGFAVGMALQGSLSNFAAGIILIVVKPFSVGHFVEVGGVSGTVKEIQLFSSVLQTTDGLRLIIPNGQITSNVIKNFSIEPTRMIPLVIGCGYCDDLREVKKLLLSVVESQENVLQEPAPLVAVDELGASSVNFVVRPWVNNADFGSTKRELTERIKLAFDEHGFSFPYPSQDVYLHQESGNS